MNFQLLSVKSFQNKGFHMAKSAGHITDANSTFDNTLRIDGKRSNQWFVDAGESDISPNKKLAVQTPNSKINSEFSNANIPSWGNTSSFQTVPSQFIDRLFGSETASSINFSHISPVEKDNFNLRMENFDNQFGDNASVGLSVSHAMDDPETSVNYGGIRKDKINQVRESDYALHTPRGHNSDRVPNTNLSTEQACNRASETGHASVSRVDIKEDECATLVSHSFNKEVAPLESLGPTYRKGDDNAVPISHNAYDKGNASIISFGGFSNKQDIIPVGRPRSSYDLLYNQSSRQATETVCGKDSDSSDAKAVASGNLVAKSKPETISKGKAELKCSRKEAPNSFPSNVRSLISTGMLDGVPVKYMSLTREELRGIIKGSGYLCGCQSCNNSKVLNAYEFERHAGCKTKHPNNHIYFENGKTIYQIVQELRSTPESLLFDAVQTVFGAPINQKSFRIWKESFQAATRELHRIYGKEELNL